METHPEAVFDKWASIRYLRMIKANYACQAKLFATVRIALRCCYIVLLDRKRYWGSTQPMRRSLECEEYLRGEHEPYLINDK